MNNSDKERNLRIAETMCRDFQWQGRSFHEGECVALLDGDIVAVTDNPDDAIAALRAMGPKSPTWNGRPNHASHRGRDSVTWTWHPCFFPASLTRK